MTDSSRPRVVVVGAGFGGVSVVRRLSRLPVETVLIDQRNYHLFTPLLYQVASALLDPSDVAAPTRAVLRGIRNLEFRMAEVTAVDVPGSTLTTDMGPVPYDHLVVAAGSVNNFFGNESLEQQAEGLKDLGEALALRNRVLDCFERAAWTPAGAERDRLLTFVVIGGGPTGVEFAGALTELIRLVLRRDFPGHDLTFARVVLVESEAALLPMFPPRARETARRTLAGRGVDVRLNTHVERVDAGLVHLRAGDPIPASTVVWTAGVRASGLGARFTTAPARQGRVPVLPTLQLGDAPNVWMVGDIAHLEQDGAALPMLAPVAIQQGRHAAGNIGRVLRGVEPLPFRYRDHGMMATIGRNCAVVSLGGHEYGGFPGWITWLVVHLAMIVTFRNRLVVLLSWAWEYIFFDRPVRLIAMAASPKPPPP
ncbi:MAG: NAD(P)/FAD-dependent oxidoreductase [Candidatus Dormibacteria bacterium]